MDQLDLFILRGLRGFFEVQLAADRNAEDKIALLFASGDERLENLLRRLTNPFGGMKTAEIIFVIRIFARLIRKFCRVQ